MAFLFLSFVICEANVKNKRLSTVPRMKVILILIFTATSLSNDNRSNCRNNSNTRCSECLEVRWTVMEPGGPRRSHWLLWEGQGGGAMGLVMDSVFTCKFFFSNLDSIIYVLLT